MSSLEILTIVLIAFAGGVGGLGLSSLFVDGRY